MAKVILIIWLICTVGIWLPVTLEQHEQHSGRLAIKQTGETGDTFIVNKADIHVIGDIALPVSTQHIFLCILKIKCTVGIYVKAH